MFIAFAIILDLASGQVRPAADTSVKYKTYQECVASMPERLAPLEQVMGDPKRKQIVTLGCIKDPGIPA